MKVKELIEILKECDPEDLIVLSKDPEGNGYKEARTYDMCRFTEGEIGLRELDEEHKELGYEKEDVFDEGEDCIVLWP